VSAGARRRRVGVNAGRRPPGWAWRWRRREAVHRQRRRLCRESPINVRRRWSPPPTGGRRGSAIPPPISAH